MADLKRKLQINHEDLPSWRTDLSIRNGNALESLQGCLEFSFEALNIVAGTTLYVVTPAFWIQHCAKHPTELQASYFCCACTDLFCPHCTVTHLQDHGDHVVRQLRGKSETDGPDQLDAAVFESLAKALEHQNDHEALQRRLAFLTAATVELEAEKERVSQQLEKCLETFGDWKDKTLDFAVERCRQLKHQRLSAGSKELQVAGGNPKLKLHEDCGGCRKELKGRSSHPVLVQGRSMRFCETCFEALSHTVGDQAWAAGVTAIYQNVREFLRVNAIIQALGSGPPCLRWIDKQAHEEDWAAEGIFGCTGCAVSRGPASLMFVKWIRVDTNWDFRLLPDDTLRLDHLSRLMKMCPNVEALAISDTCDFQIVKLLSTLPNCKCLDISGSRPEYVDDDRLTDLTKAMPRLVELNVSCCALTKVPMLPARQPVISINMEGCSRYWKAQGDSLTTGERQLKISGQCYNQMDCYLIAASLGSTDADLWVRVASGFERGARPSLPQFSAPMTNDLRYWTAVIGLGSSIAAEWKPNGADLVAAEGQNPDVNVAIIACLATAVELEPKSPKLWTKLGCKLFTTPRLFEAARRTDRDCFMEALRLDPDYSSAWRNLGISLKRRAPSHQSFDGKHLSPEGCCIEAIRSNPRSALAWTTLANFLGKSGQRLQIPPRNESYGSIECCVQALKLAPDYAQAWVELAEVMTSDHVDVGGQLLSKFECRMRGEKRSSHGEEE